MNAVYDAAAARRRALEAELVAANDSQLASQRALAVSQAQITALLKERDQLDTWLTANQNSVQPGSAT